MAAVHTVDVLIIGAGAAGLTLALSLPDSMSICLLCKNELGSGATAWAQGGIAGVLDSSDSVADHVADTLKTAEGLGDEAVIHHTIENSKAAIEWLIDQGVPFTHQANTSNYHLTREGGHSHRRIIHAADATGLALSQTLTQLVANKPNIQVLTERVAVDLIIQTVAGDERCVGAYVLNAQTSEVSTVAAQATVLATGGASKVYLYTTNPDGATGDGIAMAWRAGCSVVNMEFNQFHPTCLFHPKAKSFLISEAVRGEGGVLRTPDGQRFMPRFHPDAELAPRDVVARAIDHEMKRLGVDFVWLDISHQPKDFILYHFPTIYHRCLTLGIDITGEPIPVVPAAHYSCGGVSVDMNAKTEINRLYAVGECAHTGLHGANRLASNSLLECVVFARAAAAHILDQPFGDELPELPSWDASRVTDSDERVVISHNWLEIRRFMWDYVGIVRTDKRLQRALNRIQLLQQEIHDYYANFHVTPDLLELRNLALVAQLMIEAALLRQESRGLHYTLSHPHPLSNPKSSRLHKVLV